VVSFEAVGELAKHPWGTLLSEHRLNRLFLSELDTALTQIESQLPDLSGVVFTGQGRFFSNGFDLEFFKTVSHSEALEVQTHFEKLLVRILKLPVVTVAALNGHTAAAGALLSWAFDFRMMNAAHGIFYIPAAKLGLAYSPGLVELCRSRMTPQVFRDVALLTKKFPATEAHANGIIDKLVPESELIDEAVNLFMEHALPQSLFKMRMNRSIIDAFESATPSERDMGWSLFTSKY
jgi:enoyl-CoA hydratase/carnithine racemase